MSERGAFSPQRNDVLIDLSLVCASLSFCGSVVIVASYLRFPQMRKRAYELVTWLAVADLLANVSYFMGNPYSSTALCKSQAVIQQFFQVALIQWTVVIAAAMRGVTMAMKVYRSEKQRMWKYHVYVWGIAAVLTALPAITDSYGHSGAWCWIESDGTFKDAGTWWRLFAFYVPLWISMLYVVYTYVMIIRSLAQHMHAQESVGGGRHTLSGDSSAAGGISGSGGAGAGAVKPDKPRRSRKKMFSAIRMTPDAFGKVARRASVSIGSWAGINASETLHTSDPNRRRSLSVALDNGFDNGVDDGLINGVDNDLINGVGNGLSNGVDNGLSNGLGNGLVGRQLAAHEHLRLPALASSGGEEGEEAPKTPMRAQLGLASPRGGVEEQEHEGFEAPAAEALGFPAAAPTLAAARPGAFVSGVSGISAKDQGRSPSYVPLARRSSGAHSLHTRRSSAASNEGTAGVAKFIQRVKWYPVIFVFCWIFASINRVQNMVNSDNPRFVLYLLQVTTVRIQGFLNALAYGFYGGVGDVWRGDPHIVAAMEWLHRVFCCCRRDGEGDAVPGTGKADVSLSAHGGRKAATLPRAPIGGAIGGEIDEDSKNGKGDLEAAAVDAVETTSASPAR